MLKRIAWLVVAAPAAALLLTLAVTNRHPVTLVLDPFRPEAPALSLTLPFYVYLLGALITGVLLGGFATWLSQSRWRKTARVRSVEARRWREEADRLTRERDSEITGRSKDLVPIARRNAA